MKNKTIQNLNDLWFDHNDNIYLCPSCANWFSVNDNIREFAICINCKKQYKITVSPKHQIKP